MFQLVWKSAASLLEAADAQQAIFLSSAFPVVVIGWPRERNDGLLLP